MAFALHFESANILKVKQWALETQNYRNPLALPGRVEARRPQGATSDLQWTTTKTASAVMVTTLLARPKELMRPVVSAVHRAIRTLDLLRELRLLTIHTQFAGAAISMVAPASFIKSRFFVGEEHWL